MSENRVVAKRDETGSAVATKKSTIAKREEEDLSAEGIRERYSEAIQNNYSTQIGTVEVKNLSKGPLGKEIEVFMTAFRDMCITQVEDNRDIVKDIYSSFIYPELLLTLDTQDITITTKNNCECNGARFVPRDIALINIPTAGIITTELLFKKLNKMNRELCNR